MTSSCTPPLESKEIKIRIIHVYVLVLSMITRLQHMDEGDPYTSHYNLKVTKCCIVLCIDFYNFTSKVQILSVLKHNF